MLVTRFYENEGDANRLYFYLERQASTQPAAPFVFDGPATEQHQRQYPAAYKAYLSQKDEPSEE